MVIKNIKFINPSVTGGNASYGTAVVVGSIFRKYNPTSSDKLIFEKIGIENGEVKHNNINSRYASIVCNICDIGSPTIVDCYAYCDMKNIASARSVAGLCVSWYYDTMSISTSIWSGTINNGSDIGPIITNDKNADRGGTVTNCYYDKTKFTKAVTTNAVGLTTAQFKVQSNFSGFDFTNTWIMKDGKPELRIFLTQEEIYALEHPST